MGMKRIKLSDAIKNKGKTKESVKNMSESEIKRRADRDPDNPVLSSEQLKEFKLANKKDNANDKEN